MTTLMSSTNKALPKISYVKSIDVFLGTCFVMVFAALLGITFIYCMDTDTGLLETEQEIYMLDPFLFPFFLAEYATVGYLAKRIQMRKNHFAALQRMAIQLQTAREEHFHTLRQTVNDLTSISSSSFPHPSLVSVKNILRRASVFSPCKTWGGFLIQEITLRLPIYGTTEKKTGLRLPRSGTRTCSYLPT